MAIKYVDQTALTSLIGKIKGGLAEKVDAVDGMGLSHNDYTDADKTKLTGIASGAQTNVIESITVNGTAAAITNKGVALTIPTSTSELVNDSNFVTSSNLNNYVQKEDGKGLSTNDLTDELKATYDQTVSSVGSLVAEGGQPNTIETISVNGENVTPDANKNVAITIPTNVSSLTNDSGYLVADDITDKVDKVEGKGLSTNDYTTTEKEKLAGIASGAEVNTISVVKVNNAALTTTDKTVNIDLTGKVDKVDGMGLSANSYTTDEKTKLATVAENADANVIETVKVNGTALTPTSKAVDVTVPTKVSDLTNDSGFQTSSDVSSAIADAISDITSIEMTVVESLPPEGVAGTIYLTAIEGANGSNIYEEYIYVDGAYEMLGTTEVDLSDYAKTNDFTALTSSEIDTMWGA